MTTNVCCENPLFPSVTLTVIVDVPKRLATGVTVMVRSAPLPPKTTLFTGISLVFDDVAVSLRFAAGVSTSPTVMAIGPVPPTVSSSIIWSPISETVGKSLTAVAVIVKVCAGRTLVSTPPFSVLPSSCNRTVTITVPLASGAVAKVNVPVAETSGSSLKNASLLVVTKKSKV